MGRPVLLAAALTCLAARGGASWTRKSRAGAATPTCDGGGDPLVSVEGAFSGAECEAIEALFLKHAALEDDVRAGHGISRRNRWLPAGVVTSGALDWVAERILEVTPGDPWGGGRTAAAFLREDVEFVLMHEFRAGDFFDWHVDAAPDDGKARTLNVNVALSSAGDFAGGALQVGDANASLARGALHAYPASLPHKVYDVTRGARRTLVVATRGKRGADRPAYWSAAEFHHERLCASALGAAHAKLHWIHGEFLAASGDADAAARKFADAYRSTAEAPTYAATFAADGAEKHEAGDLAGAAADLAMAARIAPGEPAYRADLGVLRWRLGHLVNAERDLRAALEIDDAPGLRAALSLVLRDAGDAAGADRERRAALAAGGTAAKAAFDALGGE